MNKRFQAFVSSTYKDLRDERREVIKALLGHDCFPAGMEHFSAADEDQWTYIKGVIEESDFYIVIVAGRYGSTLGDGSSVTEREYRYALEIGKPILGFVHGNPERIPADKTESDPDKKVRLEEFRKLVKRKICKQWETPIELAWAVSTSVSRLISLNSMTGWMKADRVATDEANAELLDLRKKYESLEHKYLEAINAPPPGNEKFARGDETYPISVCYELNFHMGSKTDTQTLEFTPSWDQLFGAIAGSMIAPTDIRTLNVVLSDYIHKCVRHRLETPNCGYGYERPEVKGPFIDSEHITTILIQFDALGLVDSARQSLTERGRLRLRNLRAIPSTNNESTSDDS